LREVRAPLKWERQNLLFSQTQDASKTLTGGRRRIMQKCSSCGNEFSGNQCPSCGGKPLPSARQINKALKNYPVPSFAGLLGVIAANHFYPLLDSNLLIVIALCIFFFPMIFHVVSAARKRLALDVNRLKAAYLYGLSLIHI